MWDNSSPVKAMHSSSGIKTASDGLKMIGFPMYLLNSGINKVMLNPKQKLSADHLHYWNIDMADFDRGVKLVQLPNDTPRMVMSRCDNQASPDYES